MSEPKFGNLELILCFLQVYFILQHRRRISLKAWNYESFVLTCFCITRLFLGEAEAASSWCFSIKEKGSSYIAGSLRWLWNHLSSTQNARLCFNITEKRSSSGLCLALSCSKCFSYRFILWLNFITRCNCKGWLSSGDLLRCSRLTVICFAPGITQGKNLIAVVDTPLTTQFSGTQL